MADKDYFSCFAWALPRAFKEPLASCCFEQGDILYDTSKAYEGTWADALQHLSYGIQIKFPSRGTKLKAKKDADFIFSKNWKQRVELDLWEYPSKAKRSLVTTQGRLYMALWKGDPRLLDLGMPEPPVPILPREVLKDLPSAGTALLQKYGQNIANPVIFIMPFDETRDLLREKRQKVESCLGRKFSFHLHLATPEELKLPNASNYVPTLEIACFAMDTSQKDRVYECLKLALYAPSKERKTEIDRFRLETHGCLAPKD